jgi:hypothetical protein
MASPAEDDKKRKRAINEQDAFVDKEFGDNILKGLHKGGEKRAHKILRRLIDAFPKCLSGADYEKCDNCGALGPSADMHHEVEGYKHYTYTLCNDCTFWCKTCSETFDESAEYKHESYDHHKTCKWTEREDESSESDSSGDDTSSESETESKPESEADPYANSFDGKPPTTGDDSYAHIASLEGGIQEKTQWAEAFAKKLREQGHVCVQLQECAPPNVLWCGSKTAAECKSFLAQTITVS